MTTITLPRATVEQALSLCESVHGLRTDDEDGSTVWCQELIDALREALAEPVQEPYDQSALELCEECGWKTRMPDEGCLNCARLQKQEPVASRLLTDDEIQAEWSLTPQNEKAEGLWFGRRIERLVRDIALAQQRKPLTDEEPVREPVEETLWPVWDTGPTNKDIEDAMRIQRLNQIISPHRKWVGLTDEEKSELMHKYKHIETGWLHDADLIAETEAKLKEKNT